MSLWRHGLVNGFPSQYYSHIIAALISLEARPQECLSHPFDGFYWNLNRLDRSMAFHLLVGPGGRSFLGRGRPSLWVFRVCGFRYDGIWFDPVEMGRLCYPTQHLAGSWYFSRKAVTVQGGYGVVFAVMVQILLRAGAIGVQVWSEPRIYPRLQSWWRALAQLSRYNL